MHRESIPTSGTPKDVLNVPSPTSMIPSSFVLSPNRSVDSKWYLLDGWTVPCFIFAGEGGWWLCPLRSSKRTPSWAFPGIISERKLRQLKPTEGDVKKPFLWLIDGQTIISRHDVCFLQRVFLTFHLKGDLSYNKSLFWPPFLPLYIHWSAQSFHENWSSCITSHKIKKNSQKSGEKNKSEKKRA